MSRRHGADASLTATAALATALGTLALWPLFDTWTWLAPTLACVGAVFALGALSRALSWPAFVTPIVQGVGVVVVTSLVLVRGHLWAGVVPTGETVDDLRTLLHAGLDQAATYAAPVPVMPGLVALAMMGLGLVAIFIDVTAVTLRSPAVAGLPLLVLYVVPASVMAGGTPWWSFVPGAVGWLLLLAAGSRAQTRAWADQSPAVATIPEAVGARMPGAAARQAGLIALVLALTVPILIPGLTEPALGRGGGGEGPSLGAASGVSLNPLVSLKRDYLDPGDRDVLVVTTDDTGRAEAPYLRLLALEEFDGTTWTTPPLTPRPEAELNGGMPQAVDGLEDQQSRSQRVWTVRVSGLRGPYLPMPFPAVRQTIGGGWFVDPPTGTVFSEQFTSANTVYSVTTVDTSFDAETMRQRSRDARALKPSVDDPTGATVSLSALTPQDSESLAALARSVVAATDNDFDAAVALQQWFRDNFRYSTSVRSGNDTSYLQQFLTDRVGYCEQFAATMALMARSLGIPARVGVGFAPGRAVSPDAWSVSAHDAHAWPELWMAGSGWTRFEPTPRSGDGSAVAAPAYARPDGGGPTGAETPVGASAQPSRNSPRDPAGSEREGSTDVVTAAPGDGRLPLLVPLGVVALLLLLATPLALRLSRRRRRLAQSDGRAGAAWDELRDSAVDHGRRWWPSETPRQVAARLSSSLSLSPHACEALQRLVDDLEAEAYSDPTTAASRRPSAAVASDLRILRGALAERTRGRQRWAAVLLPASLRRRTSAGPAGADDHHLVPA